MRHCTSDIIEIDDCFCFAHLGKLFQLQCERLNVGMDVTDATSSRFTVHKMEFKF